ncbi:molybdopterin-dependent oxidoreductase [Sphingobium sp. 10 DY56-G10]|uniref:Nitrate reductase n=2 Tax=Sphingobium TaxID=165695 RepID=A0A437J3U1_9SPHN|nr:MULTISPECIES: nitrate reductase [Sphingomonadaceae]MEE2740831.1 molybdopterin-dependent oxidoreductase [Pseudomonadota bacterium]EAT07268.1 molybdopterin oxidoreductase [Sphingomonas sp. SKA58]EQB12483.1 nitrate reductase [Sphingobium lactosutens DS20]EQB18188.1 nitrate reductase [Sphingobium lactosutens DS20]RVT39231.1 nitrate reductase [Sphingobium algorifonticola]|tara:strand:+ start:11915 stop:14524 length:2610 start_codon:yes stop_codon:yes gene_type:complete
MQEAVRTTCAYCGVGCGIVATPTGPRLVSVRGDEAHPANGGRLCSKGTHLGETVGLQGRLLHPMIGGKRAGWDKALDLVAKRFRDAIDRHGPDSVAFYVSGQLMTEDYYVANKLMKGFIGSANIDTNSRLCMSSAVAGHNRAFGEDIVPASYDDLDAADLIVLVGSNTAWCHPIVYQRIQAARAARGTKLVVIDPRRTETCEGADLHLPIRPGTDVALMNGLLAWCNATWTIDRTFIERSITAPEGFWEHIRNGHDLWTTAQTCDVEPALIKQFFEMFAATPRTVTLFSQGVNQSIRGTDQVNAIINVHLATGRIGKPGAAPFSITGQPNAMGGREVGGLASTLAAHMDFAPDNVARVGRFWAAPNMATKPGLKAVDLFRAVDEGRIKALWIMATNPAVSMPDAGRVRDALAFVPFLVVSDIMANTDSSTHAHVSLPAAGWGEKDGTVTNSDRTISRQRPFMALPGEAKPDWWIVKEVGRRMGWANAFAYDRPADIWREHARLTAYQNDGQRLLNLKDKATIGNEAYEAMEPFRWGGRPFADRSFATPEGKARLVLTRQMDVQPPLKDWPMTLNTGRYRDQWHTMSRTGLSPKLSRHREEPLVEVHPQDAAALGLADGDLARVDTAQGNSVFRVALNEGQRVGEIFTPIHWTDRTSSGGRTGLLPRPLVDPHSGQPGFKSTPASVTRVETEWKGFLILRGETFPHIPCLWATKITVPGGALFEVAGNGDPARLEALLPHGERVEALDRAKGTRRVASINEGRLQAVLFVTRTGLLPSRDWLIAQLEAVNVGGSVLAARGPGSQPDKGATVCVCFDIGLNQIVAAIRDQHLMDVAAVGAALGAGTNCGSCRPAIATIFTQTMQETLDAAE